ncbi:VWA domain-containing protein [Candidatus Woesearchaeota archaeon]|nr:VWA domain-containing protein [Candidatus Woesearchaeota archaeon]
MSNAANFFLEPTLLYALLLLIPFLLIYFIRPKPKHEVIPTLMFLFKDMGRDKKTTFFRRLIHDLLFLLQLLALLLLLLSLAKPYINVAKESLFKNTVIVLDASASMKADYDGGTRFEEAISLAKKNLGLVNTLIIVKKTPNVVLIDKSSGEIKDYLNGLKPTDTTTNLYDSINAAGAYAKADSRVVVISDFIDTETDSSLSTARKTLESQGIKVDFLSVNKAVNNVGIVDLKIDEKKTTAVIKNYNQEEANVKARINDLEEYLSIPANSQELFSFSTPPGTSKLEIELQGAKDGFGPDNTAYISTVSDVKKKVLMITNTPNPERTFLFNVLDVMKNIEIEIAIPPKIPDLGGYDVFIFKDINPGLVLPGTYDGVKKELDEKGSAAIIIAQSSPSMLSIDYQGLLPMWANDTIKSEAGANIIPGASESLTADIEFGITKKYFSMSLMPEKPIVTLAAADDKNLLITFNSLGNGKVFFYGILDEDKEADASFAKTPYYFTFWKRIMDFATNTPSLYELNYKTGSMIVFGEAQKIATPEGAITTDQLALESMGLYSLNDRALAVNLINNKESDVNNQGNTDEEGFAQTSEKFKEKVPFELTDYLLVGVIIILLLEFLYIKARGDL